MSTSTFEHVASSDRYREARLRLADRTAAISERVDERLEEVHRRHGLSWRLLLASQRRVMKQLRIPSATAFWEVEAAPVAASLTTAALLAIEPEFDTLDDALARFQRSVGPLIGSVRVEHLVRVDASAVIWPLTDCGIDRRSIDELGERWQARLHRQAVRRSLLRHPTMSRSKLMTQVAREELAMLDRPPWSHGDRLLSAFEIAHGEIRGRIKERVIAAPSVIVADRPGRQLGTSV